MKVGYARFPNPNVFDISARDIGNQVIAPVLVLLATIFNFVVQLNQASSFSPHSSLCTFPTNKNTNGPDRRTHTRTFGTQRALNPTLSPLPFLSPCSHRHLSAHLAPAPSQLVQEKELKLKLLLRISGVRDSAMWISWWIFFIGYALILSFEWYLAGKLFRSQCHSRLPLPLL